MVGGSARVAPVAAGSLVTAWVCAWDRGGSIAALDWLPASLLLAALLGTVLVSGSAVAPSRAALLSLGGLLGLAAWNGLSLLWTPLPSLARDEVLLVVTYAIAFALPVLSLRAHRERLAAGAAVGATAAGIGLLAAAELWRGADAATHFAIGRLEFPITYANAQAAVLLIGLWPCLAVAATRTAPALVRATFTGAAASLLAGWLATQSKGGGIGLAVSALLVFTLSRQRLRLAVPTLLAAACAVAAARPLTEPYRAEDAALQSASESVGRTLLFVAVAAGALGLAYALLDRRLELSARARRIAGAAAGAAVIAAVATVLVVLLTAFGRPDRALADAWDSFSTFHRAGSAETHLASLGGSNRYDFWRVSLEGAREAPLQGIGARGFQAEYLQRGRSSETPARAHSLPLDVLLELGAVGLLLLLLALVPALWAAAWWLRRGQLWATGALGACSGWIAHALADWTWTFPAAGIPFFLLLGVGASAGPGRTLTRRAARAGAVATIATTLVLLAPAWLSARLVDRALKEPARAAADLRLARRLDPVTTRPLIAQAQRASDREEAVRVLRQAAEQEPDSVAVRYLLGLTLLDAGRADDARAELAAALRLAPRELLVQQALLRAQAAK